MRSESAGYANMLSKTYAVLTNCNSKRGESPILYAVLRPGPSFVISDVQWCGTVVRLAKLLTRK